MKFAYVMILPFAALLAITSCTAESDESWGFGAMLSDDTTSVEGLTRSGDRIVSEAIETSPMVVRRHWEATLAPDGSLRRWTMDTHIPNAPPGESDLHREMELSEGKIRLVRQAGTESTDRTVTDPYTRTLPWNAFVYGTYDLLMQASHGLPDTTSIGQHFFEGWSDGNIGIARLSSSSTESRSPPPSSPSIRATTAPRGTPCLIPAGWIVPSSTRRPSARGGRTRHCLPPAVRQVRRATPRGGEKYKGLRRGRVSNFCSSYAALLPRSGEGECLSLRIVF